VVVAVALGWVALGPGVREVVHTEEYEAAAALVEREGRGDDAVVAVPDYARHGLGRYLEDADRRIGRLVPDGDAYRVQAPGRPKPDRVWVLYRGGDAIFDRTTRQRAWLDEAYPAVVQRHDMGFLSLELRASDGVP
jgi:hypothetical protein